MMPVLVVLLPFLGVVLAPLSAMKSRMAATLGAVSVTGAALVCLLTASPVVLAGDAVAVSWPWVPGFGLSFALRIDGLSLLFASLILGIGLLILVYSHAYMPASDPLGRFHGLLLLFMGAMLGIVLADNLILLSLFWEVTSLSSFLLIGYHGKQGDARRSALLALTITGAGGLALLGGVLLLGHVVGSFAMTDVLASAPVVASHPLALPILILILIGAFTKSAQMPFHFWLPAAMVAPTPVSAYLHSAAMVKAGIFLIARFWPVFAGQDAWFFLVGGFGLVTFVLAAYCALFQNDFKGLLAYSTISHLGMIMMLFGFGTPMAAVSALVHTLAHALFKAPLFMIAGSIDHATGTRDLRRLGGLWPAMPATACAALLASAAMAGIPPLNGFIGKEMMLGNAVATVSMTIAGWAVPIAATLGALISAAYAIHLFATVFLRRAPVSLGRRVHEVAWPMLLPAALLSGLCLVTGIVPGATLGPLVDAAAHAMLRAPVPEHTLSLWHGINTALVLSAAALAGGLLLALRRPALARLNRRMPLPDLAVRFEIGLNAVLGTLAAGVRAVHDGSPQRSVTVLWIVVLTMSWFAGRAVTLGVGDRPMVEVLTISIPPWMILLAAAAGVALLHARRLLALIFLSTVGLFVSLVFVLFSAPDLALTQLSVEIITTLLLLLALHLMPKTDIDTRSRRWLPDGLLGVAAGAGTGLLAWEVMTRDHQSISGYFATRAVPEAGGHNVVNVILTDFRAFDTFGEVTVMAIAAIGVLGLVKGLLDQGGDPRAAYMGLDEHRSWDVHPPVLSIVARLLLPLALLVSLYLLLRGHNYPGGGFVAGIVASVAIITQYMANGVVPTQARVPLNYRLIIVSGILLALGTGLASWPFGMPFLTSTFLHVEWPVIGTFELASALLFDLGVFLTVAAVTLLVLSTVAGIVTRPQKEVEETKIPEMKIPETAAEEGAAWR